MAQTEFFTSPQGRRLAYCQSPGAGPGVIFLGGFKSDMEGTKAVHLEAWAKGAGRAFLRFDYSGHGSSSGVFEEGSIGEWAEVEVFRERGEWGAKLREGTRTQIIVDYDREKFLQTLMQ